MRPRVLLSAALVVVVSSPAVRHPRPTPTPRIARRRPRTSPARSTGRSARSPTITAPRSDRRRPTTELFDAGTQKTPTRSWGRSPTRPTTRVGPPAWVFVTPNTCYATAKGDLVSPGRTGRLHGAEPVCPGRECDDRRAARRVHRVRHTDPVGAGPCGKTPAGGGDDSGRNDPAPLSEPGRVLRRPESDKHLSLRELLLRHDRRGGSRAPRRATGTTGRRTPRGSRPPSAPDTRSTRSCRARRRTAAGDRGTRARPLDCDPSRRSRSGRARPRGPARPVTSTGAPPRPRSGYRPPRPHTSAPSGCRRTMLGAPRTSSREAPFPRRRR